jgi:hypothetical protein
MPQPVYKTADELVALSRISAFIIIEVVCPIRRIEEIGEHNNVVLEKQPRKNCSYIPGFSQVKANLFLRYFRQKSIGTLTTVGAYTSHVR